MLLMSLYAMHYPIKAGIIIYTQRHDPWGALVAIKGTKNQAKLINYLLT